MRKSELRRIIREEISAITESSIGRITRYTIKLDTSKYKRRDALKLARLLANENYTHNGRAVYRVVDEHPNYNRFHSLVGTIAVYSDDLYDVWYFVEQDREKQRPTR